MSEKYQHDEIASELQKENEWLAIDDICKKFGMHAMQAHGIVKRIETSGNYNIEIKKEGGFKYFRVLPSDTLTREQELMRLALFGVPISKKL